MSEEMCGSVVEWVKPHCIALTGVGLISMAAQLDMQWQNTQCITCLQTTSAELTPCGGVRSCWIYGWNWGKILIDHLLSLPYSQSSSKIIGTHG